MNVFVQMFHRAQDTINRNMKQVGFIVSKGHLQHEQFL